MRNPPSTRRRTRPLPADFTLGRERFAQISAVEGIELTPEMRETFRSFDAQGLSAEDRRRAIVARFRRPTV